MYMTRAELEADLFQLQAAVPRWRTVLPDDTDFWDPFEDLSERLMDRTAPYDRPHLHRRLVDMLAARGLSAPSTH